MEISLHFARVNFFKVAPKYCPSILLASKAFNMRLQEQEYKGGFNTKNLYYQSVTWIGKDTFGQSRLQREVTDAWCQRKFTHAGQEFTNEAPELTAQEIESIPGAKASMGNLDAVKFEVLERTGEKMVIRSDEHRYWSCQGGNISTSYATLREKHAQLIATQNVPAASEDTGATAASSGDSAGGAGDQTEAPQEEVMESIGKLEEKYGIELKSSAEATNVDLFRCKDGSIWIHSNQDRVLPKHALLGGFGTGQWVPESDSSPGIPFTMSQGDRSIVQLDESSFAAESQGISTLSLFKLLVRGERDKGLTQHRVSFLTIERKQDGAVEAGSDGFEIKIKAGMKFRCLKDPRSSEGANERVTCKNFFSKALDSLQGSQHIMTLFRFRYEKIGQSFKIQRPYVVTKRGISLKKDCPLKVSGNAAS